MIRMKLMNDMKLFVNKVEEQLNTMYNLEGDSRFSRKTSPTEFEKLVVDASKIVIDRQKIKCTIDYTEGGHAFPDIVYQFNDSVSYGIEVKSSTQAKASKKSWTTLGNSILGSTRVDVKDLFIIFIKVGDNGCFIKSARYEDVVSDVAVTHSPRYKLDLNQAPDESFFSKSGIAYSDMVASEDPIGLVTDYFKEQDMTAWWVAESTPAIIKNWNELDSKEQDEILAKSFILFPEIIYSNSRDKYRRLSKWLVAEYSVVDSSLRDKFTAGGKVNLSFGEKSFEKMPKIFGTLNNLILLFSKELENVPSEELKEYWEFFNFQDDTYKNRLKFWKSKLLKELKKDPRKSTYIDCMNNILFKIDRP